MKSGKSTILVLYYAFKSSRELGMLWLRQKRYLLSLLLLLFAVELEAGSRFFVL